MNRSVVLLLVDQPPRRFRHEWEKDKGNRDKAITRDERGPVGPARGLVSCVGHHDRGREGTQNEGGWSGSGQDASQSQRRDLANVRHAQRVHGPGGKPSHEPPTEEDRIGCRDGFQSDGQNSETENNSQRKSTANLIGSPCHKHRAHDCPALAASVFCQMHHRGYLRCLWSSIVCRLPERWQNVVAVEWFPEIVSELRNPEHRAPRRLTIVVGEGTPERVDAPDHCPCVLVFGFDCDLDRRF